MTIHYAFSLLFSEGMLPVPDLGKFGRSEQLHLALMGLEHAKPVSGAAAVAARSDDVYEAVLAATKAINEERKAHKDELSVDEVIIVRLGRVGSVLNHTFLRLMKLLFVVLHTSIRAASHLWQPLLVGLLPRYERVNSSGLTDSGQEVVKYTGKFTPLHQSLYWDMFELADDDTMDSKGDEVTYLGPCYP